MARMHPTALMLRRRRSAVSKHEGVSGALWRPPSRRALRALLRMRGEGGRGGERTVRRRTPTALMLRSARSGRLEARGRLQRALDPPSRRSLRLLLRMRGRGKDEPASEGPRTRPRAARRCCAPPQHEGLRGLPHCPSGLACGASEGQHCRSSAGAGRTSPRFPGQAERSAAQIRMRGGVRGTSVRGSTLGLPGGSGEGEPVAPGSPDLRFAPSGKGGEIG